MVSAALSITMFACFQVNGGDDDDGGSCACDTTYACTSGCACDPECSGGGGGDGGMTTKKPLGADCSCGGGAEYCSDSTCATNYCLWGDGFEGYCSQSCNTTACPAGYTCTTDITNDSWCYKNPTVPACGACTSSSDCIGFQYNGYTVEAACFNGRCRQRCSPGTTACTCQAGTPAGGDATGYCANDGC